jgi:hypothetical protein
MPWAAGPGQADSNLNAQLAPIACTPGRPGPPVNGPARVTDSGSERVELDGDDAMMKSAAGPPGQGRPMAL